MEIFVDEAIELLEKANADLEPELLSGDSAHSLLEAYARREARRIRRRGARAQARRRIAHRTRQREHA
jgi:hypothetical protein